jgi:preprotein translocase subunit SecA
MHSAAAIDQRWFGRYPERADDPAEARDRQVWRTLGSPLWSARAQLRRAHAFVARVGALEPALRDASESDIAGRLRELRRALSRQGLVGDAPVEAFALVREVARRRLELRPHDCQLLGAWAMLNGRLAEMDTGEGKTLAIAVAAATAALAHRRVHVITVNDYLAERDTSSLEPLYAALGLRAASVSQAVRSPAERGLRWRADVVYCTNKGLVFDYLRDRTLIGARRGPLHRELDLICGRGEPLLAGLDFGIVDEADSVLIDECRTPLVLSRERPPLYEPWVFAEVLEFARALRPVEHFRIVAGERRVELTAEGCDALAQRVTGGHDFWAAARRREELARQALSALHLFRRDEQYIVRGGAVQIVDPNTGRVMPDRSWELGLQQMIETKESLALTGGKETVARITYQRFFARYRRLAAATGTASEVAAELWRVYGLRVLRIPRHRPSGSVAEGTTVHVSEAGHRAALLERVRAAHGSKRPVLLATRTVAMSEALSALLREARLAHTVLNARQDAAEAEIVARAGLAGRITVATNMAGRGTDIKLGPGTELLGGLHVIAAECNESVRLDRQLFGRAGRQGDPGSFESVLCLEDELLRNHSPAWLRRQLAALHGSYPQLAQRLARRLIAFVQARVERRLATQRRQALEEDRKLGDALAFAGSME